MAALVVAALLAAACSAASADPRPAVAAQADAGQVDAVVSANTGLALELLRSVQQDSDNQNIVLGPHSVSTAMTIALGGARDKTADELRAALGHSLTGTGLQDTVAALDTSLRARNGGTTQLALANRVWLQDDIDVVPEFIKLVTDTYDAGPELVDFRTEAAAAIADVNDWGNEQTQGAIPAILGAVGAPKRLRWIVVNATYFKGEWQNEFDPSLTVDTSFMLGDGTTVQVPTMRADFEAPTRRGDGWRSVRLPYRDGGLSMIVVVPNDLERFIQNLDVDTWRQAASSFTESGTSRIEMPRFSTRTHRDLVPIFEDLGVSDAFGCQADFTGIFNFDLGFDEGDTNIGFIQHEAFIQVDESGAEAAAVTAVGGFQKVSGGLPDDPPFVVDRPFVYAITDDLTGAILFLGATLDPRIEASAAAPPAVDPLLCG